MSSSRRNARFDRAASGLLWAKKLLAIAALVQLPFLLPIMMHTKLPDGLLGVIVVVSAVFGIIGFVITNRQLDLQGEALAESPIDGLIGPNLKGGMTLFFYGAFLIPLLNLVIIVWAYARASSAIQTLRRIFDDELAKQERKAKLTGGVSDAFRNAP